MWIVHFGVSRFAYAATCRIARLPGGPDRKLLTPQPTEAFTSKLSMVWSPAPSLDITTAVTGQFCRWVSHPLEQRLALLHILPDDISANLSPDAWSPTPAVPRSAYAYFFLLVVGLPQWEIGSASRYDPRTRLFTGYLFEAADIPLCSGL